MDENLVKFLNMNKGKKVIRDSSSDDEEDQDSSSREYGLLSLEKLSLGPNKKLLVLGLGGLLCHRIYRYATSTIPQFRRPDASYGSILGNSFVPLFLGLST